MRDQKRNTHKTHKNMALSNYLPTGAKEGEQKNHHKRASVQQTEELKIRAQATATKINNRSNTTNNLAIGARLERTLLHGLLNRGRYQRPSPQK